MEKEGKPDRNSTALDITRKAYHQQWEGFGGPEGTAVTLDDIASLLTTRLVLEKLEQDAPPELRSLLNMIKRNPLRQLSAHTITMDNPAIRAYTLKWLRGEKMRLTMAEAFHGEDLPGIAAVTETTRQLTACQTAIQVLEEGLSDARG